MDGGLFPGVRTRPGPPSPLLRAMWAEAVYDDPNWNEDSFRRTADLAAANRIMPELRADKTAIAPFLRRGGKAILYQGWADPSTNAGPTIDYYARLARANGGLDALDDPVRLFMVPGMYHCARRSRRRPVRRFGPADRWPGDPVARRAVGVDRLGREGPRARTADRDKVGTASRPSPVRSARFRRRRARTGRGRSGRRHPIGARSIRRC